MAATQGTVTRSREPRPPLTPNRDAPWPCWKTNTTTPRLAASESAVVIRVLTGISSEPVKANSSTRIVSATAPIAHGAPRSSIAS